jgi:hypothetical protein
MAFFPEAGLDLSALPDASRGADLDMIRYRRAGLAEARLPACRLSQVRPGEIRPMAHWLTSAASDRAKPNLWIELPGLSLLFA